MNDAVRVLVVDDIESNRFLLEEALETLGVELRLADGGATALRIVEGWEPEVVLVDLQMPGMDGFEVSRRLRSRPGGEATYVLVLSGHRDTAEQSGFGRSGADDFLAKPYTLDDVRDRVRQGMRIARTRRSERG